MDVYYIGKVDKILNDKKRSVAKWTIVIKHYVWLKGQNSKCVHIAVMNKNSFFISKSSKLFFYRIDPYDS